MCSFRKIHPSSTSSSLSLSPPTVLFLHWKTLTVTISMPNSFKHSFLLYSMARFLPLIYSIMWVFSFNLGEGWRGIQCLGGERGAGQSMGCQSTEVARLTFTHPLSYWATAEQGWHWNTVLTECQAVHVKKLSTRKHYSLNMTFCCSLSL